MKMKYFFPLIIAVIALITACSSEDDATYLGAIRVSQSYVPLPADGGSVEIDLTAAAEWNVTEKPQWLTVAPESGKAGETAIRLTVDAAVESRDSMMCIVCAGETQQIKVVQTKDKVELPISTCAEVNEGVDGKTYRVKGVVTVIENTTYGNMRITDGTGEVYIYGTLDAGGNPKNFLSLGIEAGDEIVVEGPRKTYGTTVELVDVSVISINKSLISINSVEPENAVLPLEGGEFKVELTSKGDGVSAVVPEDAKSWLSVTSVQASGTSAVVTFNAQPNAGGDRSTTLVFKTSKDNKDYTTETKLTQKGSVVEVSIADFNASPDGSAQYKLSGVITKIANDTYGNIYIKDATGEAYIYGVLTADGQSKQFAALGMKVGDVVTVVGPKSSYNGAPQMKNGVYESHISVTPVSVADFRNVADSKTDYYMLTGKVEKVTESGAKDDIETYGNFNLTDETGSVYVYGVKTGWNGESKKFGTLGVKYGDTITILATKSTYKELIEAVGVYVSHTPAE